MQAEQGKKLCYCLLPAINSDLFALL